MFFLILRKTGKSLHWKALHTQIEFSLTGFVGLKILAPPEAGSQARQLD